MKKTVCRVLKFATALTALGGVILSLVSAQKDGYSHWLKRLLYFTAQSNIWIGVTFLALALLPLIGADKRKVWRSRLYLLKYIFTVSITVTGLIFCALLAPFSDESYTPWTFCNLLTHVFTPALAVTDFFLDDTPISLTSKQVFLTALPPLSYFLFASALELVGLDFGRGVPYPYFFLNYRSPVGLFKISLAGPYPFFIGTFYWLALFLLIVLGLGFLYARAKRQKAHNKKARRALNEAR